MLRTAAVALLFAVVSGSATVAQLLPPLTPEQEAIAQRLDGMFIAPCCFVNTLAEHRSPVAEQLRQELRTLLAGGTLFMVGHSRLNLTQGAGGPRQSELLWEPSDIRREVAALGLSVRGAKHVRRRVETAEGVKDAIDTLVLAEREAN